MVKELKKDYEKAFSWYKIVAEREEMNMHN